MDITSIKQNMKAHSGETFQTKTGCEFCLNYDGGTIFDVTPFDREGHRAEPHHCTITNLERVVDAVNSGKIYNLESATIADIKIKSESTASESYIYGLLTDNRIV